VRWDKPPVYGVAMKREDVRARPSAFNRRGEIEAAFRAVIAAVQARVLLVSFNDEGYLAPATVRAMLAARGEVSTIAVSHPRYVGSRIGIYNPRGEKVGVPGKTRNREHLFLVETTTDSPSAPAGLPPAPLVRPSAPSARST
jgi:adenine-specific DNA-methyltransferase